MTTKLRVSLEEFLAMPEDKPYRELLDGEVIEKAMPIDDHGVLDNELLFLLNLFRREHPGFHIVPEVRHIDTATSWVYLPDIAVTLHHRLAPRGVNPVPVAPDLAIEILSPDDRPGLISHRVANYLAAGTTLLWLVDPERREITVFQRGANPSVAIEGESLSADPVLPGFEIDITALFAALDRPRS